MKSPWRGGGALVCMPKSVGGCTKMTMGSGGGKNTLKSQHHKFYDPSAKDISLLCDRLRHKNHYVAHTHERCCYMLLGYQRWRAEVGCQLMRTSPFEATLSQHQHEHINSPSWKSVSSWETVSTLMLSLPREIN